jgi:hypothetical protein
VDDPDLARAKAAARPPPSYAEEDAQAPEEGQKGSRSNVSLVPKSTAEYLKVGSVTELSMSKVWQNGKAIRHSRLQHMCSYN